MAESSVESKPVSQLKFGVERIRKDAIGRWREFNLSQKTKREENHIPGCRAGANGGIPVQAEGSLLAIPTQSENQQAEESNHHPEQFSIAAFAKPSPHHFSPQFCGQIVGRDRRDLRPRARPFDGAFSCKCRSASRSDGIRYIAGASVSIIEGSSAMSRSRSDNSGRIIIGRALSHRAGRARSHTFIVQWGSVSADRPRGGG